MPTQLVSSEASLLDVQVATLLLSLHTVFPLCVPLCCLCVQISSYKDISQMRLRPILTASFYLVDSISKYSHIQRYWGLGLQCMNFGGTQFIPQQG